MSRRLRLLAAVAAVTCACGQVGEITTVGERAHVPDASANLAAASRRAPVLPPPGPAPVVDLLGPEPAVGNPPAELVGALALALADPRLAGARVGASVWVEGYGEVVAVDPDLALVPASNQKLLTALGALRTLPADRRLLTTVTSSGPLVGGVLGGDLVLVGGGDATLTTWGPHSLDALAAQLAGAGVRVVAGDVVADETRHSPARIAPGWQPWHVPTYAGPLSALMVDGNRFRTDAAYLADPAAGNAEAFRSVLEARGVTVTGGARSGAAADGARVLASVASATVAEQVVAMLRWSDNEIAEQMTREVGLARTGEGSTIAGAAAVLDALREIGIDLPGGSSDGSGLSRTNLRSARELRRLLEAAAATPHWPLLSSGLPVAGRTGTLTNRLIGTAAEGNVAAKTGSLLEGRSLAGTLMTAGGRRVTFAVVVNGDGWSPTVEPIDALVAALAADAS